MIPIPMLIAFYFLMPALILWLCYKSTVIDKIGSVILAYLFGILLGNSGFLPEGAAGIQDELSGITVALALPLLLFSMDVRSWLHSAGKAILSMLGATILVVFVAGLGSWMIQAQVDNAWQFGGMAIGLYTGGTPNLAAIKTALNVDSTQYIMMHTYDAVNGIIYLIFVMSIGQRVFNKVLPKFKSTILETAALQSSEDIHSYVGIFKGRILMGLLASLGISIVILGLSFGLSQLVSEEYSTAAIMLLITTMGIASSFIRKIRVIPMTFQFGMYIILVFSLIVGSMANLEQLVNINWSMMFFVNFIVFGTMLLHAAFCKLFNIDTDTFLITSVSAVCSPPFVPVVAKALNNKEIILSGLTTGIIGYAIGNYLGVGFAYVFRAFLN
ncbi:MAG: DUF819 family protein [Candidatus Marinimicrobia bacterium]|jgi:uncharacterized membrane protein|nr:DUF819 family protein [Candidatus Neomarinimicrobiota bacterium]MBT3630951.1 DUF819 family protein [Candidatus Neomarinimicrobiota bacterium]MBT3825005.1 DUF819 family protein [Candidatus Neomarinimicrobiota bacterium]MBT4130821.1 DUF819 family protein [Candidatus Neomarinimicrobiota bacterium]MBT4296286.1 DUF819 family protein [Candidatus Neomarinimicrobiota bacterium]